MRTITCYLFLVLLPFLPQHLNAQEEKNQQKIEELQKSKDEVLKHEKEALKLEVERINEQLKHEVITEAKAISLKEEAAKKHALNIENRVAIIDNRISLLERNEEETLIVKESEDYDDGTVEIDINGDRVLTFNSKEWYNKDIKYDRRTYSDPVMAVGFSNAIIDGESFNDSPYKLGGSRFFDIGWAWRTRIFKKSNAIRLNYGFSFQFNGLKPKGNQYFVVNDGQVELEEFEYGLRKSKFRMDNLVFPVYLEFGPSKYKVSEHKVRYSIRNQFRFGIGGYAGFNMGSRQVLKYSRDGENVKDKLKGGYNTSDLIYGVSAYMGFGCVQLYGKYDLSPIFQDAAVEQRMVAMGLRFDFN